MPLMVAKAFSWNGNATRDAARQGDTFVCDVVFSFWEKLNSDQQGMNSMRSEAMFWKHLINRTGSLCLYHSILHQSVFILVCGILGRNAFMFDFFFLVRVFSL